MIHSPKTHTNVWGVRLVVVAVVVVMLTGLLRYIDLVGDYIGAAILFAVFAVILLVSARYWKKHLADTEAVS